MNLLLSTKSLNIYKFNSERDFRWLRNKSKNNFCDFKLHCFTHKMYDTCYEGR